MKRFTSRRQLGVFSVLVTSALFVETFGESRASAQSIDRRALVTRHHPLLEEFDVEAPLSVGNGQFAFTVDATGLQTYPERFHETIPLGTLSHWGWHTAPNPEGWHIDKFEFNQFDSHGRMVGYADIPGNRRTPEINWLRANPHRLHLGQIGFVLKKSNGEPADAGDLQDMKQTLDLWRGEIVSRFEIEGAPVEVVTLCHPQLDAIAVRVESPLARVGRLAIRIRFPYGTGATTAADWTRPEAHATTVQQSRDDGARFARQLDDDEYYASARWTPTAQLNEAGAHEYLVEPSDDGRPLELVVCFSAEPMDDAPPTFAETQSAARAHWEKFWSTGGAIDLSGSRDPRWRELERRIVLSQYLTAIQCSGQYPPQESGLTFNSWEGKFHLEMHWWHAVHFALWDRIELLENSLGYYQDVLPKAQGTAARQGYSGARWQKMTSPTGDESPSSVGPFLVWQQPHPIYYAELCRKLRGDEATLEKYRDVVFATAEFMASFAAWDDETGQYMLGPPLQCAQEEFPKDRTFNPTYELTYWRWGLQTAQSWRERLGMEREPNWDRVLQNLSKPTIVDGKYLFAESVPDSYTNPRWAHDHPSVLMAYGFLPGPGIDRPTMGRTLDWVWENWAWPDTWGWDYPMVAMSAARLGQPERAVDALLMDTPKNYYRPNGHNHQRPGLTIYLPGNGGLLTAAAMMAHGWPESENRNAPGFPQDGSWRVRSENLRTGL